MILRPAILFLFLCLLVMIVGCRRNTRTITCNVSIAFTSERLRPLAGAKFYLLKEDITKKTGSFYSSSGGIDESVIKPYVFDTATMDENSSVDFKDTIRRKCFIVGFVRASKGSSYAVWNVESLTGRFDDVGASHQLSRNNALEVRDN